MLLCGEGVLGGLCEFVAGGGFCFHREIYVCVCLWGIFARAFIRGACVYLGVFASLFLMSQIIAKK